MSDDILLPGSESTLKLRAKIHKELQCLTPTNTSRPVDSRRWFHGRGRELPDLSFICIDFFDPVIHITLFRECDAQWLKDLVTGLQDDIAEQGLDDSIAAINVQERFQVGAPSYVAWGELPDEVYAQRQGLRFHLNLNARQNSGFFLDMEPGRRWLEQFAQGARVLNLFSYTCAFSAVALAAGSCKVVNVDMASGALKQGRDNHRINGFDKKLSVFLCENILKSWSRIRRPGPYDIVIIDPPSYQPGSFVASKDYAKIVRRIPELMPGGGRVLACLNAPELGDDFLKQVFADEVPGSVFVERLRPNEDFPDVDPARQLKLLVFDYHPA